MSKVSDDIAPEICMVKGKNLNIITFQYIIFKLGILTKAFYSAVFMDFRWLIPVKVKSQKNNNASPKA